MKAVSFVTFLVVVLLAQSGCYTLSQSWHQLSLLSSATPIPEVLATNQVQGEERTKLESISIILEYAKKQGLETDGSYKKFVKTGEPAVTYLVLGAPKDKLELQTWWFPFVGTVPYLGFFSEVERDKEAVKMRALGFDVYTTSAAAFSSLGWFDDPVYDSMLQYDILSLWEIILHELVHRNFWLAGQTEFNENMAEWAARELVRQYLKEQEKLDQLAYLELLQTDKEKFDSWLRQLEAALREFYSKSSNLSEKEFNERKTRIFAEYLKIKLPKFKTRAYDYLNQKEWNNATVLSSTLYVSREDEFTKAYACKGERTVVKFLEEITEKAYQLADPFEALDGFCH